MITFLTSNPGGQTEIDGESIATILNPENNFIHNLKLFWKADSNILLIASSPDDFDRNERMKKIFIDSFSMSGLTISNIDICDNRNNEIVNNISSYDVVILSGGHVPTQNQFFKQISLKENIQTFHGILIGISAGTMNCANEVYAQPELDGESIDGNYQRFISGLGITKRSILPHYQFIKDCFLDEQRVMEDITYPDSMGKTFYGLVDGSYILCKDNIETLHGEAYTISNGELNKICERDNVLILTTDTK